MKRDNEFFDRLDSGAGSSAIGTTLGWELISVKPDEGTIEIAYSADGRFLNPFGLVQGGILGSMLDDTLGSVMISVLERGQIAPTTDLHVQFLRPAKPGRFTGRGRIVRRGKSIAFLSGELSDAGNQVIAVATATATITGLCEAHGQFFQPVHEAYRPPAEFLRACREFHLREPGEQRPEGDLGLRPGQERAQAMVDSVPEGQVTAGVTPDVDPVRIGEPVRIPVSRTDRREGPFTRRDRHAADGHLLGGEPVVVARLA